MANEKLIEALKKELKHYEIYKKADRAEEVKKAIKAAGGKLEKASAKPKAEKKVANKDKQDLMPKHYGKKMKGGKGKGRKKGR